ncbi:Gfo/Idh/MocA family protein [Ramlibacter sp. MAHUQ-53]|uniref:Gfo/Idh/MocA family protein n=1 Tax=unclassified Ramlibacter TaxID=2617605 RepID=UPI0036363AC1
MAAPMKPARIRLGMVGGGEGAFIGAVHRIAARLDDQYELVAGALSSTPEKARRSGLALGLAPERTYDSYEAMAEAEAARDDGIEAVVIVTPNHVHAPAARAFLKAGIHVICDKPVTVRSADARALKKLAEQKGLVFAVTHNYSAYPMVRVARQLVQSGRLGEVRVVQAEYPQDWLAEPLERSGQKQAAWRTDPAQAGGGAIGDIGSHAWHLADFVTGQPLTELCAELSTFVPGRPIDDNAQVMLRYANGARGMIWASQVAPGHLNDLRLRVYGSKGGLEWSQEHPNQLRYTPLGQPTQILERAGAAFEAAGARMARIPGGHPEGYLEAFASLYGEIAQHLRAARRGGRKADKASHFPTIADGLRGVQFIEAVQRSSRLGGRWVRLPGEAA